MPIFPTKTVIFIQVATLEICAVIKGIDRSLKSIIERELVDTYVSLDFEGHSFKVFSGYKEYLTNMFGDYMQLPPEDKRVTHHTFTAYAK